MPRTRPMVCPCCKQTIKGRPDPTQYVAALPIRGKQTHDFLKILAERFGRVVEYEHIISSLYAFDPEGGPLSAKSVVKTILCRLRPRLHKYRLKIETTYNVGLALRWDDD